MKDILIVVKPRRDGFHESYNKLRNEVLKYKESTREILETAFLLKGPKSFEIVKSCIQIAHEENIQLAFFEIESCLYVPNMAG